MFDLSLKKGFDPLNVKEDYLIEDILQRNFMSGVLERQKPKIEYDFYDLTDKWMNSKEQWNRYENTQYRTLFLFKGFLFPYPSLNPCP